MSEAAETKRGPIRILVVENEDLRVQFLKDELPPRFRLVWAKTGGAALAMLKRDKAEDYAGVMLDHDLDRANYGPLTAQCNGVKVAEKLVELQWDQPVLVHSMNPVGGAKMATLLERNGFPTTRIPFSELTQERFQKWLCEVEGLARDE